MPGSKIHVRDKRVAIGAGLLAAAIALWLFHQAWYARGQKPPRPLRPFLPDMS